MLALKGAGYLQLRLGDYETALARLEKVSELDSNDRLGAKALIDVAREALDQTGNQPMDRTGDRTVNNHAAS
jgi:hypothetical protein